MLYVKEISKLLNGAKTLVFFDLEGTQFSQEIIAIGAFKCTLDNKNNIKKVFPGFKVFVKSHDEVGKIVTKITGITDSLLDSEGINFYSAMQKFKKYVGTSHSIRYISYGNFDVRLLHQTAKIAALSEDDFIKSIFKNYIDFAAVFGKYIKSSKGTQLSLLDALKVFNTTPEGEAHDPLFDAKNLMLLYGDFVTNKSKLLESYLQVLQKHCYPYNAINKLLAKLAKDGTVSTEDLKNFASEDLKW